VGLVDGAKKSIQSEIGNMGTNLIFVLPGSGKAGGQRLGMGTLTTLTEEDATALLQECPSVSMTTPFVRTSGQAVYANRNWSTALVGANEDFLPIRKWELESGSCFNRNDYRNANKVCLIGPTVAENLFGGLNPIGKTIRFRKMPLVVIGVLAARGQSSTGDDQDDRIIAPFPTVQRRLLNIGHAHLIMVSAATDEEVDQAQEEIEVVLRRRHRLSDEQESDFQMSTQADLSAMADSTLGTIALFLIIVASVALVVGGINIMNTMLVSVTERTREIGTRMAVGARSWDILIQFLLEAVTLSSLGGALGVLSGLAVTRLIITGFTPWEVTDSPSAIVISVLFSAGVGVFFGIYPAWKASRLDPIEALRYE
jgi:putative ABC transport system permease protein